jgi:twitching motility protein PilT
MVNYKQKLEELLLTTAQQGASDLHLGVGYRPTLRIDGRLVALSKEPILNSETSAGLVQALLTDFQKDELEKDREVDFAYALEDKARFRVNAYYQRGFLTASLRLIPSTIRTIEDLSLPPILHDFARLKQGFVLIVGPAGHGKSTTLAAVLDEINHSRMDHIVTIEDPIEYLFTQDRCIISQREVRSDTPNFNQALRSILRQDPDVIMIGEMRDADSIKTAMTAAETGHLVFSTLHTNSASQTIDRIIDTFPSGQQSQATSQLAATLAAVVSERLIPKIGGGRVPAYEIMIANSAARNLIRERKAYQIDLVIETSQKEGMTTLNHTLAKLVKAKQITLEEAEKNSLNPSELKILVERKT